MSKYIGLMYRPDTKQPVKVWSGFNWPNLFFGPFWYAYFSMWKWLVISAALAFFTWGVSWFVFPFFANKQLIADLMDKGFHASSETKEYLIGKGMATKAYPEFTEE